MTLYEVDKQNWDVELNEYGHNEKTQMLGNELGNSNRAKCFNLEPHERCGLCGLQVGAKFIQQHLQYVILYTYIYSNKNIFRFLFENPIAPTALRSSGGSKGLKVARKLIQIE